MADSVRGRERPQQMKAAHLEGDGRGRRRTCLPLDRPWSRLEAPRGKSPAVRLDRGAPPGAGAGPEHWPRRSRARTQGRGAPRDRPPPGCRPRRLPACCRLTCGTERVGGAAPRHDCQADPRRRLRVAGARYAGRTSRRRRPASVGRPRRVVDPGQASQGRGGRRRVRAQAASGRAGPTSPEGSVTRAVRTTSVRDSRKTASPRRRAR